MAAGLAFGACWVVVPAASAALTVDDRSADFHARNDARCQFCSILVEQSFDSDDEGPGDADPGTAPYSFSRAFSHNASASDSHMNAHASIGSTYSSVLTYGSDNLHLTVDGDATTSPSVQADGTERAQAFGKSTGNTDLHFTITEPMQYAITASGSPDVFVSDASRNFTSASSMTFAGGAGAIDVELHNGQLTGPMSGTLPPGSYSFTSRTQDDATLVQLDAGSDSTTLAANGHFSLTVSPPACTARDDLQVGNATAQGCFTERKDGQGHGTGVFETSQVAWVGGFELHPRPGGKVVLDTNAPATVHEEGAGADILMDGNVVPVPIALLPVAISDATIDLNQSGTLEKVFLKLPFKGTVKVAWAADGKSSSVAFDISIDKLTQLLGPLAPSQGGDVSAKATFSLVNGKGLDIPSFEVKIDAINVLPFASSTGGQELGFKNLLLRYERRDGKPFYTGQGFVTLPVKSDSIDVGGRVFILDGRLAGAGIGVDGINKPIANTPLFLQKLEGDLIMEPKFGFDLGVGATFGPKIEGKQLFTLEGQIGEGSAIAPADCPNGPDPFKIDARLKFEPLDKLIESKIVKVDMLLRTCGYVGEKFGQDATITGKIDFFGGELGYEGTQSGFVGSTGANLDGGVTLRIPLLPTIAGKALVSTKAIAACGSLGVGQAGFAYRWGSSKPPEPFTGCSLAPFKVTAKGATASAAAATRASVAVPAGLPHVVLAVSSRSGAPHVTVTGPGGVRLRTPRKGALRTRHALIVPFAPTHTTYVFVDDPRPGAWRIAADRAITRVRSANGLPAPKVTAKLRKRGTKRVLTYRLRRIPGQSVRFFEHGTDLDRDLGRAVRRGSGRLTFTPRAGAPKARTIVARVTESGLPRADLIVARYGVS